MPETCLLVQGGGGGRGGGGRGGGGRCKVKIIFKTKFRVCVPVSKIREKHVLRQLQSFFLQVPSNLHVFCMSFVRSRHIENIFND